MHSDFNIPQIRESVCELAYKARQLKLEARVALQQARVVAKHRKVQGEAPVDPWQDPLYRAFFAVLEKRRTRGSCSRYHQLAYAFARGRDYKQVEQYTRPGNAPSARIILEVLSPAVRADRAVLIPLLRREIEAWLAKIDTCLSFEPTQGAA